MGGVLPRLAQFGVTVVSMHNPESLITARKRDMEIIKISFI